MEAIGRVDGARVSAYGTQRCYCILDACGEKGDKSLSIYIENPDVLNVPLCTHEILHMYHDTLRCTEHPPMYP